MKPGQGILMIIAGMAFASMLAFPAVAADTDDGISEAMDEPIAADDNTGSKDTNINFIVVEAVSKAKVMQKKQDEMDEKISDSKSKSKTNLDDGDDETNENSIVLAPGSHADKVINVVIQK